MLEQSDIVIALQSFSRRHGDAPPFGATGDFWLDMALADAFRALIECPDINSKLRWIDRERGRVRDGAYSAALLVWWLDLFQAEKLPIIEARSAERNALCASF